MSERWLILETSGRGGRIGLTRGDHLAHSAELDPARRHNRDLAPTVGALLQAEGIQSKDLTGVMVSLGPGSFTGLRVGIMSAKVLAYVTGCPLIGVPTFHAIAEQTPREAQTVDVLADALQGLVYVQPFHQTESGIWQPLQELRIVAVSEWSTQIRPDVWLSGPGVEVVERLATLPNPRVPAEMRTAGLEALFRVGTRLQPLPRDEMMILEPLYLRPSSAEEKAARSPSLIR